MRINALEQEWLQIFGKFFAIYLDAATVIDVPGLPHHVVATENVYSGYQNPYNQYTG